MQMGVAFPASCLSTSVSDVFPCFHLFHVTMSDAPQAKDYAYQTACECYPIGIFVAVTTIWTVYPPVGKSPRMNIIDSSYSLISVSILLSCSSKNHTIGQVENVAKENRRQRHATPILAESLQAEGFGNESGINAEEETVRHWFEGSAMH